jgi:hypothetical protein
VDMMLEMGAIAGMRKDSRDTRLRLNWIARRAGVLVMGVALCRMTVAGRLVAQDAGRHPLPTEREDGLTLEGVLDQLQKNLSEYRNAVPDLYCNEHVVSSMDERRSRTATVTDSVFRLRKRRREDGLVEFEESRVLQAVDGKVPVNGSESLSGPAVLSGVFSDGLQVVSREVRGCYVYTLHPLREGHPKDKLVVDFRDLPPEERAAGCLPFEGTSGQATIDPVSMHVVRLEKSTPDPDRILGKRGTWKWRVDYAPVKLMGDTFWMPQTIRSTSRTEDGMYQWEFDGTYRNYHLFHAESRIVPVEP